ncbi:proton-conducting transporter transmembrane domain-containing protein [Marinobacter psychrophilus]|uniref:proton-conducting transporter transmembrane domain-containing protein n=1 Tax=Marinobacter psychrophilus TaxID=330734 RepID=UPI0022283406|nr:proton-conducting transporter membrane subunit [Marinobacter psychrophilus]
MLTAASYGACQSLALQFASVMLVIEALLKCDQLPIHGWFLRFMEAPTPISAWLHASVVNRSGV